MCITSELDCCISPIWPSCTWSLNPVLNTWFRAKALRYPVDVRGNTKKIAVAPSKMRIASKGEGKQECAVHGEHRGRQHHQERDDRKEIVVSVTPAGEQPHHHDEKHEVD